MSKFKVGDVIEGIDNGKIATILLVGKRFYRMQGHPNRAGLTIKYTDKYYKLHIKKVKNTKIARLVHKDKIKEETKDWLTIYG